MELTGFRFDINKMLFLFNKLFNEYISDIVIIPLFLFETAHKTNWK